MKNIFLEKLIYTDENNFTTKLGIRFRKIYDKTILNLLTKGHLAIKGNFISPEKEDDNLFNAELEKGENYIYVSNHSFDEDILSAFALIDRPVYGLIGTIDQIKYNPKMIMTWLVGMIGVDRENPESRENAYKKMKKILSEKVSVLLFPEGGLNNTENLPIKSFFPGVLKLALETKTKVVPLVTFQPNDNLNIHTGRLEPIDLYEKLSEEEIRFYLENVNKIKIYLEEINDLEEQINKESYNKINELYDLIYKIKKIEEKGLSFIREPMGYAISEFIRKYGGANIRSNINEESKENFKNQRIELYVRSAKWSEPSQVNLEMVDYDNKLYNPNQSYVATSFDKVKITSLNIDLIKNWKKISLNHHKYYAKETDMEKYMEERNNKEEKGKISSRG
ncbi:MAG: lysophospholipid acyltransferase family protein [Bacilli bacterium]|nr:lysophospholipid acyltransferase family protein [Bacilli bacterium]